MNPLKKPIVLTEKLERDGVIELCQILEDFSEVFEDIYGLALHVSKVKAKADKDYPDRPELRRLLERVRERLLNYAEDCEMLKKSYKQAITDFEHANGPVLYDARKRVFDFHTLIAMPKQLSVKSVGYKRIEQDDDFPY